MAAQNCVGQFKVEGHSDWKIGGFKKAKTCCRKLKLKHCWDYLYNVIANRLSTGQLAPSDSWSSTSGPIQGPSQVFNGSRRAAISQADGYTRWALSKTRHSIEVPHSVSRHRCCVCISQFFNIHSTKPSCDASSVWWWSATPVHSAMHWWYFHCRACASRFVVKQIWMTQ